MSRSIVPALAAVTLAVAFAAAVPSTPAVAAPLPGIAGGDSARGASLVEKTGWRRWRYVGPHRYWWRRWRWRRW